MAGRGAKTIEERTLDLLDAGYMLHSQAWSGVEPING